MALHPFEWSLNARSVLEARYLKRDSEGRLAETPDELLVRVAEAVASVERGAVARRYWAGRFLGWMQAGVFLPNSPTLMNAGKKGGQLSACFVLPIEDSLDGIFTSLRDAAEIHQSGGGTGFSFSRLRPKGSRVQSTQGVASGPVSFLRIFDTATETIKQGGTRRGANMGILRIDHPDIREFISAKRDGQLFRNFNFSVGVTEEFFRALLEGRDFALRDPNSGRVAESIAAQELFDGVVEAAWACGDPGLVFLDRINLFNPTPKLGPMESTNPCGEQPLLPYESCNLGSLNLARFIRPGPGGRGQGSFDWEEFRQATWDAVRFLDNVIDLNVFPLQACESLTRKNRKIGLGVMGFADALLEVGVAYDSPEALRWAERWMSFLDREAKRASAFLAQERGAFDGFRGSLWARLGYPALRNATVSTVAPTGTLSLLAGCSSGVEPIFAGVLTRNVLDGKRLTDVHPWVLAAASQQREATERLTEAECARLGGPAWRTAREIAPEVHVRVQAAFQRHSDSAVSKTINLPSSATRDQVAEAFLLAYRLGCKGITVYRDRSREAQVLTEEASDDVPTPESVGCPTC